MTQAVDPQVSKRKFEREVDHLRSVQGTMVARGWWLMKAEFPVVKVAFATVNLRPRMIPFALKADFTDYDVRPLAVTFVDPFEDRELLPNEMGTHLPRLAALPSPPTIDGMAPVLMQRVDLYQHYPARPDLPGFLCLPGVRAYHDHPAHSGDPWEIYRTEATGRLFDLLETVWRYGTVPLDRLNIVFAPGQGAIPE